MSAQLTVADVLERAADLIEPEGKWTQGAFSRNDDGTADLTEDENAASSPVCWCALGAVAHITNADPNAPFAFSDGDRLTQRAAQRLREIVGFSIDEWNDEPDRKQAEVVSKLREAAALAREQVA